MNKDYKDKQILVTGGAGFIGSHLVEKLVSLGARVTVFDNLSSGSRDNLKAVKDKITFIHGDISDLFACLTVAKDQDIVFHLAALVSVPQSLTHQARTYEVNVQGTRNILEACATHKIKHIVFSSSAAIYGNQEGICIETMAPDPGSPYAITKLEGEADCADYAGRHGINTVSLRYFNVYGPRQDPQGPYAGVVAQFTQRLKAGKPIIINGTGLQTRDFIHVDAVVEANLVMGLAENIRGEVFNIASGRSITILELVKKLEKELKTPSTTISFAPSRSGDVFASQANCQKYEEFSMRNAYFPVKSNENQLLSLS